MIAEGKKMGDKWEKAPAPDYEIYEMQPTADSQGRQITIRRGTLKPSVEYVGSAVATVIGNGGQPVRIPFNFFIPAATLREAYAAFDACSKAAGENAIKSVIAECQSAQRKIEVPSPITAGRLKGLI